MRIQVPPHSTVVVESSSIAAEAIPSLGMAVALIAGEDASDDPFRLEKFARCLHQHDASLAASTSASHQEARPGRSVLAKCSEDGLHYLGVVDKVEADGVTVTFAGYGNTELVPTKHVYVLLWPQPEPQNATADAAPVSGV